MLHDVVVRMGIDAQMANLRSTKSHNLLHNSMHSAVAGDTMNGAIRRVGQPRALVNHGVGRILANDEDKNAADRAALFDLIKLFLGDIVPQQLLLWISVSSLISVSGFNHKIARVCINIYNGGQILHCCFPDHCLLLLKNIRAEGNIPLRMR